MLYYALVFLCGAIISGLLGFAGIAFAAVGIARLLFFLFLVMFLVTFLTHLARRSGRHVKGYEGPSQTKG
jgi:uncharacterized membrane protein YtjA (UPF0391 family)